MPTVGVIECPDQSQGGFFKSNVSAYMEAALSAASWLQTGRGMLKAEIERRLPGWTATMYGNTASNPGTTAPGDTGAGGSSFVADTIDPTLGSADDTPLSGNSDARLKSGTGQVYMASIDSFIAANNASTDAWIVFQYFQTWDIADTKGRDRINQCRAIALWWTLVAAKLAATGKPYRMYIVSPGFSDRSSSSFHIALLRECQQHMAVNGRRSAETALAGFPVVPNLYLLSSTTGAASFDDAQEADNVDPATGGVDRAHPSVGSSMRIARQIALGMARWINPATAQEYDGIPFVVSAFVKPGAPTTVRVKIKITPGNRLVWPAMPAEDAALAVIEGGSITAPQGISHLLVHAHRHYVPVGAPYQPLQPALIPVQSITVDNSQAASGFAFLDLVLPAKPTRGTCFSIQPAQYYRMYWRQTENIATTLKLLAGLREEAGGAPYVVDAACTDILVAGRTWLPVLGCVNVPVLASDPSP